MTEKTFSELWKFINARGSIITVQEQHELQYVYNLMKECECQSYLEIGAAEGNSLYVLGHAVKQKITYVDLNEDHTRQARNDVITQLPVPVAQIHGNSTDPESYLFASSYGEKYDCILIDGGHDFATVLSDSILYAPLATKYVFWHDIQLPEVKRAVEWFEKRYSHLGEFSTFISSESFGYKILKVKF